MKGLTKKEKLFCLYYAGMRTGREAAALAGYLMPQEAAVRLLQRRDIGEEIEKLERKASVQRDEILAGYRRLAFGSCADALKLLFSSDPSSLSPDALDLFNVSEIKKPKDGALEIKFFDRLKALEHLQSLTENEAENKELPLYEALMRSVPSGGRESEGGEFSSL